MNFSKLFILTIKYIPIIQMIGMLINNTLFLYSDSNICYFIDFVFGNSLLFSILLILVSVLFKFCLWHRIIIFANLINLAIAGLDSYIGLPIPDVELLLIYYIISVIGICIALQVHLNHNKIGGGGINEV